MRFLMNENVSATVIGTRRQNGHDVLSVKESMRSASDDVILARAQAELRILVTHDKDFGELAFRVGLPAESGVILLRLTGLDRDADNRRAIEAVESRGEQMGRSSFPARRSSFPRRVSDTNLADDAGSCATS